MSDLNPFLIHGPALISFSGGRTSAYMLWRVLHAHGGKLPEGVVVAFANTGREREETLRFVHDCAVRWEVDVVWLEFVTDLKRVGPAGRIQRVGYNSASRDGEPLRRLIARKQALFSTLRGRWCTEKCKVQTLTDYMSTIGLAPGEYTEVIGFRSDEYDRVVELPLRERNVARRFSFPLASAGVRKSDVEAFWAGQPFDLALRKGMGNCDHCPFLSDKARIARARINPEGLDWWENYETERNFAFGRMTVAEIRKQIAASPLLPFDLDDEPESDCIGWCPGVAA